MRTPRTIILGLAAAAALAVALPILLTGGRATAAALAPAAGCAELLDHFRTRAQLQFYGGRGGPTEESEEEWGVVEQAAEQSAAAADAGPFPSTGGGPAPADLGSRSEGGTNVQVAGVDESDIVKTDGEHLYIARGNRLHVAKIREGGADFIASLRIDGAGGAEGGPRELLIAGDTLLAIGSSFNEALPFNSGRFRPRRGDRIWVFEIDISDPAQPRIRRSLHSYGTFSTARLVGSSARLVLEGLPPDEYSYLHALAESAGWRDDWVDSVRLNEWLPRFVLVDHRNFNWRTGYTVACDRVHLPGGNVIWTSGGLSMLLTFDLSGQAGISEWGSVAVSAADPIVYATSNSFYIASSHDWASSSTDIHRFDLSDPAEPAYDATASVRGELINQFAMSEYRGHLRVAATDWNRWPLESALTVFDAGDELAEVGKVTGLGPTESIFAVRFLGDRGFVVTFRQTDPLYVLDLSDPAAPSVEGELKIPGFSRYLHPLGGGLLLGVGQDADPDTGRALGLQVSLFDVSAPAAPAQLARVPLGRAESAAEFDHRAFTYRDGVAYVPAQASNDRWWAEPGDPEGVLYAVEVNERSLALAATMLFPSAPLRSIPIAEQLHVLSNADIRTFALPTHAELGTAPY